MKQTLERPSRPVAQIAQHPKVNSAKSEAGNKRNWRSVHPRTHGRKGYPDPGVSIPRFRNPRKWALIWGSLGVIWIAIVWLTGRLLPAESTLTSLMDRNLAPTWAHPFGTDWLGRDMFMRTLKGLATSIQVGLLAACGGGFIALVLGLAAALGKTADRVISWIIDLFLSVPHLVSLVMLAFVFGGGLRGVALAIALTHWPNLARIVRAEMIQLKSAEYIHISRRLGHSRIRIAVQHMLPHLIPQLFVGVLLIFPHAILHEAAITFLGLGLSPQQPAIGIILSESMRYLSAGMWWLAFFPGLALLLVVRAFDVLGGSLKTITGTGSSREVG
ncbi:MULTISPECIES: ABC transporter permease [unclassified Paenibacillus]|uniref:ABC transporter permease n=1 Tax=unclassified Paenibacillus TaxID=185978 RepID=UPI0004021B34|nr:MULTISPECIES: ABC transporter permease [unclassified Paenibacillus]KGP78621.1 peptide ABC transporter permease [Paenibacillus sp. MAEPY2]KGP83307.1 peptide ABC transporter permease [Paenibacillus sp. MAEPY1]